MARPAVTHDGFLIPNANGVAEPVLAEPDQIDFNTLANAQWGVIEGCEVNAQSAKTVAISSGTAIVNGVLVLVTGTELPLPTPGANGQFVLVVVDAGGTIKLNQSAPASVDPVFPDTLANETVLASVYCDATAASFANNIVDKRKLLSKALLTKIPTTSELIRNANNVGNHYLVTGDGKTTWENGASLEQIPPSGDPTVRGEPYLRISESLIVNKELEAGNVTALEDVFAFGRLTGLNFFRGNALPAVGGIRQNGDIFIHAVTGAVYVYVDGAWSQLASMSATQGVVPIGTVIYSMQVPSVMIPLGWYPMNGTQQLTESAHPTIFTISTGGTVTGTAPNRTLTLPDLNRRTMIVDFQSPHSTGGLPKNLLTLKLDQIPTHNHNVGGDTGRTSTIAGPTPSVSVDPNSGEHSNHVVAGGYHDHPVYDPGHAHNGMDWFGVAAPMIAQVDFDGTPKDGRNKLDAMFNDSSHTYTVEPVRWTMKATTGIDIGPNYNHGHTVTGGGHGHALTINALPPHYHTVSEENVGQGKAIDITPLNFTVYSYIRA